MSSPSTKPSENRCPECGNGRLSPVVTSCTYEVEGHQVQVDGLLPLECDQCHSQVWPYAEVQRARQILAVKLKKAAA